MIKREFAVGDKVITDYSGPCTHHVVTDVDYNARSESGVAIKVKPPVPLSGLSWMDSGWFIKDWVDDEDQVHH